MFAVIGPEWFGIENPIYCFCFFCLFNHKDSHLMAFVFFLGKRLRLI
jgi:hypothetical protein